jgi:hypothetical protein
MIFIEKPKVVYVKKLAWHLIPRPFAVDPNPRLELGLA